MPQSKIGNTLKELKKKTRLMKYNDSDDTNLEELNDEELLELTKTQLKREKFTGKNLDWIRNKMKKMKTFSSYIIS